MRTIPSGILGAVGAVASQPGYLVQITTVEVVPHTYYLTSLDTDFSYNGVPWTASDLEITSIQWNSSNTGSARMTLGDADLLWWYRAVALQLQDATVRIWQCYAEASGEAQPLWIGNIGKIDRRDLAVDCELYISTMVTMTPRRRVQHVIDARWLLPSGRVIMIGSQKWVLERKTNG